MNSSILPIIGVVMISLLSGVQAVVLGIETFETDGLIAGQAGGTGFAYDNFDGELTDSISDWDNVGNIPSVVGGELVTQESSAKREYNGNVEGVGNGSNDGQDDHERSGALRGAGTVFYKFDITRSSGSTWSGISSYDFGTERIFFGVASSFAGTDEASIQLSGGIGAVDGVVRASSGISLIDDQTYTMVAALDFDNDLVGLYVDPDPSDEWSDTGGTADVTIAYNATNWSTAVRFGSGGAGPTSWDDLTIATTPEEVGLLGEVDAPVRITSIEVDEESGEITISWNSSIGTEYVVESSTDLKDNSGGTWDEVSDGHPSGGATGEITSLVLSEENGDFPAGLERIFIRVRERLGAE